MGNPQEARPVKEVLRELLHARGRRAQAELARRLNVDPDMVSRWVGRGKTTTVIKADDVPRIAAALDVTICELYGVEEGHSAAAVPVTLRFAEQMAAMLGTQPDRVEVNIIGRAGRAPAFEEPAAGSRGDTGQLADADWQPGLPTEYGSGTAAAWRALMRTSAGLPDDVRDELLAFVDQVRKGRDRQGAESK